MQRRWLALSNPGLEEVITSRLGTEAWITDLDLLAGLQLHCKDPDLQDQWNAVSFLLPGLPREGAAAMQSACSVLGRQQGGDANPKDACSPIHVAADLSRETLGSLERMSCFLRMATGIWR